MHYLFAVHDSSLISLEFVMYQINDQTVLEEDYDENYQPTEEGSLLYVLYIALLL